MKFLFSILLGFIKRHLNNKQSDSCVTHAPHLLCGFIIVYLKTPRDVSLEDKSYCEFIFLIGQQL